MDSPHDTLIFGSPPAHRISPPNSNTGLWIAAGLLGMMDVLLFLVLVKGV